MESTNINFHDLTKIPEKEFKQHFLDWMEQDEVARSLQAKLRKDLISIFNKTSLGKKIIAQTNVSRRLILSPLILALNTLVAEFLYTQNCHFSLSVFCTEVPYRNTLPDFEGASYFRFNEREIFEIFDALCNNWEKGTKDDICKEYSKEKSQSLLFVVLRSLLNNPRSSGEVKKDRQIPVVEPVQETPRQQQKSQKLDAKVEYQSNNFRYLNKYLIILSKKVKEMSQNLEQLQKQKNAPQTERKSLQARKFENLNRSLEKISENLRQITVSKKKNRKLTAVMTAVETMAKQFERCTLNFDQINRGFLNAAAAGDPGTEKSYSEWIKEMRTTNNGKKFLEKIESSLRKTLHREREKMEREFEQRLQIQKDILKTKYKQKLTEELARHTSRDTADSAQKSNESFEKKLKEFELRHQELYKRLHEAEKRMTEAPLPKSVSILKHCDVQNDNKGTQTPTETLTKPPNPPVDTHDQLHEMVKVISDQERQIDHIVFDAKFRIQELEHESNQLDRSFRDYLERQNSEKQKVRDSASSIWQSYALGKSMLDKKSATFRSSARITKKHFIIPTPVIMDAPSTTVLSIPKINIDSCSASANPSNFENPFRVAQKKVLERSKTLPPPPSKEAELNKEKKYPRHQRQQRPSVLRLIEHNDNAPEMSPPPPSRVIPGTQLSPELNIKDITLDGIEVSPTTAKSSSSMRSGESNGSSSSPRGVFKLRRQLFRGTYNREGPSGGNGQQMNSNGNKEAEEPLKQINKENGDDGVKSIDGDKRDADKKGASSEGMRDGNGSCEVRFEKPKGDKLDAPSSGQEEDVSLESFRLDISPDDGTGAEKESDNDFWA